MLQRLTNRSIFILLMLLSFIVLGWHFMSFSVTAQEEQRESMSHYLERLSETDIQVYIRFINPLDGVHVGWDVPAELESDEEIIGSRTFREIGTDYVCIGEQGLGLDNIYCIPFSNIAHITQHNLPPAD